MPKPEIIYFEFKINLVKDFLNTSNIKELVVLRRWVKKVE